MSLENSKDERVVKEKEIQTGTEKQEKICHAENARNLFMQGYNCAQAVIAAFAKEAGLKEETALRLSSGFGGGIGRTRGVCGAVSGMVMAYGLLYGYSDPKANTQKKETYQAVQQLLDRFKEKNGSTICAELLGLDKKEGISPQPERRTAKYYKKRPCPLLVQDAAGILEDYILNKNNLK